LEYSFWFLTGRFDYLSWNNIGTSYGNQPQLMRLSAHLPVDWAEQRKLLGFR
jgi:hypothetical protein